jgi:hypothetical protein
VVTEAVRRRSVRPGVAMAVGFGVVTAFLALVLGVMPGASYETWGALIVAPCLLAITLPLLARQSERERDRRLFWLLAFALVLKLGAGLVADYVAFDVYGGSADAADYHRQGVEVAERFRAGNFDPGMDKVTGSQFPILLNGIIYTITGPTRLGGFLVHAWLGFLGLFFFYRAFVIAVPDGRRRSYARLLFFLPSQIFWSSLIGKDSWMVFALGIAAIGIARILTGRMGRGLLVAGVGLWFASLVRPHVAGIAAIALAGAVVVRRPRAELRQIAPIAKAFSLVVVCVLAVMLVGQAQRFLEDSGIDTRKGFAEALNQASRGAAFGGSVFVPTPVRSPSSVPGAAIAVLFRPFITETENAQTFLAALEGTFLLALTLMRFRWGLAALRSMRRQPYVAYSLVFTGIFVFAFSSFANFGLLVRQRTQVMPLFLVLIAVPPVRRAVRGKRGTFKEPAALVSASSVESR